MSLNCCHKDAIFIMHSLASSVMRKQNFQDLQIDQHGKATLLSNSANRTLYFQTHQFIATSIKRPKSYRQSHLNGPFSHQFVCSPGLISWLKHITQWLGNQLSWGFSFVAKTYVLAYPFLVNIYIFFGPNVYEVMISVKNHSQLSDSKSSLMSDFIIRKKHINPNKSPPFLV